MRHSVGLGLCFFALRHDIAVREEDAPGNLSPCRFSTQEKFQFHAEMLVFLAERIQHDVAGDRVGFDGYSLLVSSNRLRPFGKAVHTLANVLTSADSSSGDSQY